MDGKAAPQTPHTAALATSVCSRRTRRQSSADGASSGGHRDDGPDTDCAYSSRYATLPSASNMSFASWQNWTRFDALAPRFSRRLSKAASHLTTACGRSPSSTISPSTWRNSMFRCLPQIW